MALNADTAPLSNTRVTIEVCPPLLGMGDIGVDIKRGVRSFGVGGTANVSPPPEWVLECVWVVQGPNSTLNLTCFWTTAPVIPSYNSSNLHLTKFVSEVRIVTPACARALVISSLVVATSSNEYRAYDWPFQLNRLVNQPLNSLPAVLSGGERIGDAMLWRWPAFRRSSAGAESQELI